MTFVSIIRLFDYCNIDYSDLEQLNIPRIKKQIAAEFNFAPEGFITIDGRVYNKNEVFQTLDASNVAELIAYHLKVYQANGLLQILEEGKIENLTSQELRSYIEDENFVRFISPYFAPVFNREMKNRLAAADFEGAADWIPYCRLILNTDGETAFQSTKTYLEEALRLFKNLNKDSFLVRKEEVQPWTNSFARFLNWLPDLLYPQKEALAIQLINFCVEIQESDRIYAYQISKSMLALNFLDNFHTQLIKDNHLVYESRVLGTDIIAPEREKELKKEKSKGSSYMWIIIAVVIFLVRMVSKCDNINQREFQTNEYTYSNEENNQNYQQFFDSLRKNTPIKKEKYEKTNQGQLGDIKSYFSFLNPAGIENVPYLIKLTNNSSETLELHHLYQGYVYILPLAAGKYVTLQKPDGDHIDFILQQSGTANDYTPGSINNMFFLISKDATDWSPVYFGKKLSSGYALPSELQNSQEDSLNVLEVNISIKEHTLYIDSEKMKMVKTIHR